MEIAKTEFSTHISKSVLVQLEKHFADNSKGGGGGGGG